MEKWRLFLTAVGLAMVLEGLPYFISPRAVRTYLAQLTSLGDGSLRVMGLSLMAMGLLVAYLFTR